MSDFSITKAAFSGWGLAARRPALTALLGAFGIVAGLVLAVITVQIAGPQLMQMQASQEAMRAAQQAGNTDPAAMQAQGQAMQQNLGPILQFYIVALLFALVQSAVNAGAVNRAVLRPKTSRFPFIGLTGDEFRLMVVAIVLGVMFLIPSIVLSVITLIVGIGVAGGPAALRGGGAGTMQLVLGGGGILIAVLAFLVGARFALAMAQTVAERGVRIFGSWELTKGRYWKVVAALLLSLISLIPAACIAGLILFGVARGTGVELKSLMQPDYSDMAAIMTPLSIARYVVGGLMGALATIVTSSAAAYIYNAVSGGAVAGAVEDDDDEDWDD